MGWLAHGVLGTFIPLFVATDVFAALGIFISLTEGLDRQAVKSIIRDSVLTAFVVSVCFLAFGEAVFKALGITTDDFKIAGGLVLLIFAVRDLLTSGEARKPTGKFGAVPIGVPLIVGPAVLTTLIVLLDRYGPIFTAFSLVLNLGIVWAAFVQAPVIVRYFGRGGILVFSKIMLLMLAAIAVMMIRLGIAGILTMRA
ncbi:MAG: MarC family protein [Nitrospiraceae bacterium]|nr:MarC family protein [Nitrospiraceae bacterium]